MNPTTGDLKNPQRKTFENNYGTPSEISKAEPFTNINKDRLQKVINILKNRIPRSAHIYNMAMMASKFCSIKTYSLDGDVSENAILLLIDIRQDFHQDISISVPSNFTATESVKQAFINTSVIDWTSKYMFTALDRLISPLILEISVMCKKNSTLSNPNYYYYMSQEDAANLDLEVPPEVQVKPLEAAKGEKFLVKGWKYTREGTAEFVHDIVEKGMTAGVYIGADPACGLIENRHGLIGMLYTSREHRNKGYAKLCTKYLLKQLGLNGFVGVSEVECNHVGSREFHKKLGMVETHVVDDIMFEKSGFDSK